MILALVAIGTFCSTLVGGLVALRFRDRLHLLLGFSAGAVVGVAFFDLLPEAFAFNPQPNSNAPLFVGIAAGFLFYLVMDRLATLHGGHTHEPMAFTPERRGVLGAASLALHSLLDGIAIGLAFHVSAGIGIVVAIGVLTHDFSDGINTMNLILKSGGDRRAGLKWLLLDAVAPVIGIGSTLLFTLSDRAFAMALAFFGGLFLYIGASELVPESHHAHPKFLTTAMTVLGAAVIYAAVAATR